MLKLSWSTVAAWRMGRHYLVNRAPKGSMLEVASRLCGLHAQVLSCAELTAWARVDRFDRSEVQRALWHDRKLVKTWAMRGTLHLLPSDELPLWHAALGTSKRWLKPAAWQKYFGITMEELDRITEAIGTALDGRLVTREELAAEVGRITGAAAFGTKLAESSWGTLLRPAAFSGRLCFGPSVGQKVRFTRPDSWLRMAPCQVDPAAATAAITRRFLAAHGPASFHDLARWWNGGGISTARQWIADLGDEVTPVEIEGAPAWVLSKDARELRDTPRVRAVRLLPGFDQYVVTASCHAANLLPGDLRARVFRPQGWISPVLLVNGRLQGVWRHEIKGSRVEVVIEPFVKVPAWVRKAAEEEVERLGAFLGSSPNLVWQ
ncbi:MAG TPA: winged helix DNA-binding domain-containing protein [Bryobacteraceae bacterium]|nr:winged helix DNA-binding domain-containing protein [Bryobacteraceae bacterium]